MNIPEHLHELVRQNINIECDTLVKQNLWSTILQLPIKKDGDQYYVLFGENIQDGIVGFGDTPAKAMFAFDKAMESR